MPPRLQTPGARSGLCLKGRVVNSFDPGERSLVQLTECEEVLVSQAARTCLSIMETSASIRAFVGLANADEHNSAAIVPGEVLIGFVDEHIFEGVNVPGSPAFLLHVEKHLGVNQSRVWHTGYKRVCREDPSGHREDHFSDGSRSIDKEM